MEHQHVHDDAGDGDNGDNGAGNGGGGIEDSVIFKDEVQHRLYDAQRQQGEDVLPLQREGEEGFATKFSHQGVGGHHQRHGNESGGKAEGQQHRRGCYIQCEAGEHEAHAEDYGGAQGS